MQEHVPGRVEPAKGKSDASELILSAVTFAFCLFAFVFSLSACGRKTSVRPPELVRPIVIETLAAERKAEGVVLSWERPDRYVDGSRMEDLGRFVIERSDNDGPFQALTTLAVEDRDRFRKIRKMRYTDATAVVGTAYRYRIVSATLDDYVSEPSNVAEVSP